MQGSDGRTVKLTLAYDGTDYVGWQRQENGVSVQALLEQALERIEEREVAVTGAGRTDAGVHALGQTASVRLRCVLDDRTLVRALNAMLPGDIRVLDAEPADPDFHARYAARSKTYRYRILSGGLSSPFGRRYAWHIPQALDYPAMRDTTVLLRGRHDFAAFQASGSSAATTDRTIFQCELDRLRADASAPGDGVRTNASLIAFEITGDGFLRHMVRAIVGTLVEVGSGRRDPASVEQAIQSRDRRQVGPTAPARGLFLVRVNY